MTTTGGQRVDWGEASCLALVAALESGDVAQLDPEAMAERWKPLARLAQDTPPEAYTGAIEFAGILTPGWCASASVGGPEWVADHFERALATYRDSAETTQELIDRARRVGERDQWNEAADRTLPALVGSTDPTSRHGVRGPHAAAPVTPIGATPRNGAHGHHAAATDGQTPPPGASLITPWSDFDALATSGMRFRVAGIWPADGLGFIAAAPKHGKTWLALALAISVATGRPFLGQHAVEPCPVVYVALEGSPGGLRARIGAIARGMGVNPDSDELRRALHLAYKPRGLNLSDPAWAQRLTTDVEAHQAGLVIVDVLRRAATIRESGDGVGDFAGLLRNLEPLQDHGRSLVFCHHFRKDGKNDDEVATGQRMAGTGSLHGHYDAALYITSYEQHSREMRVEVDGRDFTPPRPFRVAIQGTTSGPYGYVYEDAAELTTAGAPTRRLAKATPEEIRGFIAAAGGELSSGPILAHFDIGDETLRKRRDDLAELGVEYVGHGRDARYIILPEAGE